MGTVSCSASVWTHYTLLHSCCANGPRKASYTIRLASPIEASSLVVRDVKLKRNTKSK